MRAALLGLGALVLASALIRSVLARKLAAPQLLCDEFIYAGIAKSLALHGQFSLRHEPNGASFVYPALLAPAWRAGSMATAYDLAKTINAIVMTLAAIPFFFWARRLSSPLYALAGTCLLLLLPAFNYTGMLMTENAFLPAFLAAGFAIASSLERPTLLRQSLAVAAIILAMGIRAQAAALVLVLPTALLLEALLDRADGKPTIRRLAGALRKHAVSLGALATLGALYLGARAIRGANGSALTTYRDVLEAHYSLREGLRWTVYHLAELTLATGVVPVCAFIVVVGLVVRRSPRASSAERAFVAVGLASIFWFSLEIGFFTSRFANGVVERYTFYLAPLLLLALASWLHKGLPRPTVLTALAAIVPAALVILLPLSSFIRDSPIYSSFGLYPFHRLGAELGGNWGRVELLATAAAVLAALAFAVVPRRLVLIGLPVLLATFFLASSWPVFGKLREGAFLARYSVGLGQDSSWIEQDLGRDRPVTYLYSEDGAGQLAASRILTQAEFWNRNIEWVTNTGPSEICPLPEKDAQVEAGTGEIRPTADEGPITTPTVVTSPNVKLAGRVLKQRFPLVAHSVRSPLRLSGAYEGLYSDTWTGPDAAYSGYEVPAGDSSLSVGVSRSTWTQADVPSHVLLRVGTLAAGPDGRPRIGRVLATRRWVIHAGASRVFSFPAPRRPFRVELHVEPTFVPKDFGFPDERHLGALFNVRVIPKGLS